MTDHAAPLKSLVLRERGKPRARMAQMAAGV
jgi:hypothetical protein